MTRQQFESLPWFDQRMYIEALQDDLYERNENKWKENGKKGSRPQPPEGYHQRQFNTNENANLPRDESGRPIAKDIGDMFDLE